MKEGEKIFESDVFWMSRLFFPELEHVIVLDPFEKIKPNLGAGLHYVRKKNEVEQVGNLKGIDCLIINISDVPIDQYPFDQTSIVGIISLADEPTEYKGMKKHTLLGIDTPLDTIRWLFPDNLRSPHFIAIYNNEEIYGNIFKGYSKLTLNLGLENFLVDRKINLFKSKKYLYDKLKSLDFETFTVFTGRFLQTGKVLMQLIKANQPAYYVKCGLTPGGRQKIRHECQILEHLTTIDHDELQIPHAQMIDDWMLMEPILANKTKQDHLKLASLHFNALKAFKAPYLKEDSLQNVLRTHYVLSRLGAIYNQLKQGNLPEGLSKSQLIDLYSKLTCLLNTLPLEKRVPISLAHGEFNYQNIAIEGNTLNLLDWEEATWDAPVLYDVFYFMMFIEEKSKEFDIANFQTELEEHFQKIEFNNYVQALGNPSIQVHFNLFLIMYGIQSMEQLLAKKAVPMETNYLLQFWKDLLERIPNVLEAKTWPTQPSA